LRADDDILRQLRLPPNFDCKKGAFSSLVFERREKEEREGSASSSAEKGKVFFFVQSGQGQSRLKRTPNRRLTFRPEREKSARAEGKGAVFARRGDALKGEPFLPAKKEKRGGEGGSPWIGGKILCKTAHEVKEEWVSRGRAGIDADEGESPPDQEKNQPLPKRFVCRSEVFKGGEKFSSGTLQKKRGEGEENIVCGQKGTALKIVVLPVGGGTDSTLSKKKKDSFLIYESTREKKGKGKRGGKGRIVFVEKRDAPAPLMDMRREGKRSRGVHVRGGGGGRGLLPADLG